MAKKFAESDYQNCWIHKRRKLAQIKAMAALHCDLTPDSFILSLQIESNGEVIYARTILQTDPDEIAFQYRFKDLVVDGDDLVITSKLEEPLLRVPIAELRYGSK